MDNEDGLAMLRALIATRQSALDVDGGWVDYTDAQRRAALEALETIQRDLIQSDFSDPSAKLLALAVLLDSTDRPNFADDFKNELFDVLRRVDR